MEEIQLRFGARDSANVKLWLTGSSEEKYEANPIHLHSVILKRSEFFEVKMSDRWPSDKPAEIRVITSHDFNDYLKCIQLMYGERGYFSNVEECLAILSVASELLVDDCINKCMQYLEAVRWNADQESQIRDVLSSLGLKLLPDLGARLGKEDVDHISSVGGIIKQMVSLIQGHQATRNRNNAEKYIAGIFERNTSRDVVDVCGRVLLQEFKSSIGSRNFLSMRSLFKYIEHCEGETLKAAYVAFCEDLEFTKYVQELNEVKVSIFTFSYNYRQCGEVVHYTILWFMKAIGDGKIIISRASRISFLTTWLPIMREFCYRRVGRLDELEKAVLNVVESLPLVDKISICVAWIKLYEKNDMDIATPLTLFEDLQDTPYKSTSKQ